MKRIPIAKRVLPRYTRAEEIMNMVTHIVGGGLGIVILILCLQKTIPTAKPLNVFGICIYGISMISVYTVSSIYHGLLPSTGKKVMQVIDHCTIYFLIAGTYTPILLAAFVPKYPQIGWGLLAVQWILCAIATTLTAIDLKKFTVFSMICYIGMGWSIIFFLPQTIQVMTPPGFYILLAGGITYTLGAILFGIGSKCPWMHSVFHIFVLAGSFLQFIAIYQFVL